VEGEGRARLVALGRDGPPSSDSIEVVRPRAADLDLDGLEGLILDGRDAPGDRLVVDGLDDLVRRGGVPAAVDFYRRVCPRLYDLGTIAYWTASRPLLGASALDQIAKVAQVVLEVTDGRLRVTK